MLLWSLFQSFVALVFGFVVVVVLVCACMHGCMCSFTCYVLLCSFVKHQLQSRFQDRQGYTEKYCLEKNNKRRKPKENVCTLMEFTIQVEKEKGLGLKEQRLGINEQTDTRGYTWKTGGAEAAHARQEQWFTWVGKLWESETKLGPTDKWQRQGMLLVQARGQTCCSHIRGTTVRSG